MKVLFFMKKISLLVMTSCLVSSSAFALSFTQHQEACSNPKNFHNQIAPSKIEITCVDKQKTWKPAGVGSHSFATGRSVSIETKSDKYSSTVETGAVPSNSVDVSCPKFEEVEETVAMTFVENCDSLLTHKDGPVKYCSDKVNEARAANPEGIKAEKTGMVLSMCPSDNAQVPAQFQGKPGQAQNQDQMQYQAQQAAKGKRPVAPPR